MFFQLIAERYENKPTIIITNQPFSKWRKVFGDTTNASAIIDRLVHHSVIINIKGKSYRIKVLIENDFENQKSSEKTTILLYQKPTKKIDIYSDFRFLKLKVV